MAARGFGYLDGLGEAAHDSRHGLTFDVSLSSSAGLPETVSSVSMVTAVAVGQAASGATFVSGIRFF